MPRARDSLRPLRISRKSRDARPDDSHEDVPARCRCRPMPFAYSFQQEPFAFVLLRAVGLVDLVTWANAMQQVIGHRAFRVAMPIVLDVTEAAVPPTRGNEVILAGTWRLLTPSPSGGDRGHARCAVRCSTRGGAIVRSARPRVHRSSRRIGMAAGPVSPDGAVSCTPTSWHVRGLGPQEHLVDRIC